MAAWLCEHCGRRFGRANQAHACEPALSLAGYLGQQPAAFRPIYRAVLAVLEKLGPLDVDPVAVGIMVKHPRTFCELRPRRDGVELAFKLSREVAHPRIAKTIRYSTHRRAYFVLLCSVREVDGQIGEWLAESYAGG